MTRRQFDRATKANFGYRFTQWEHERWVRYREARRLPHPGYPPDIPPRTFGPDPYNNLNRFFTRNVNTLGRALARAINGMSGWNDREEGAMEVDEP